VVTIRRLEMLTVWVKNNIHLWILEPFQLVVRNDCKNRLDCCYTQTSFTENSDTKMKPTLLFDNTEIEKKCLITKP